MPLSLTYDILNDTPASASPIEANYNIIEQFINQDVITRDGATAMSAQLRLVGNPVSDLDAAPKGYVDTILPIGIIMMYGGVTPPIGGRWALANGAELETAAYPDLFAVLGTRFVVGTPAAGRFSLPNLADRVGVGVGPNTTSGQTGGSRELALPTHSHVIDHAHAASTTGNDNAEHTHTDPLHGHSVDIWSGYHNSEHFHGGYAGQYNIMLAGVSGAGLAGGGFVFGTGTTHWSSHYNDADGSSGLNHRHPVNGVTGNAGGGQTGGRSAVHQHAVTTPAFAGRSGVEGTTVANNNMPPYLGITYIVRIS